jgi:hypothetical protein
MWLTRPFCGHFAGSWTRYLNTVSDADPAQVPLSLLFFEFSDPCVNALQLHVYDADVLVSRGVDGTASDNRLMRGEQSVTATPRRTQMRMIGAAPGARSCMLCRDERVPKLARGGGAGSAIFSVPSTNCPLTGASGPER